MAPIATLLPFYLVCDVSGSMNDGGRIDALNDAVASTCDAAAMHPVIADRVRMGVISFAGSARIELPLCDIGMLVRVPRLRARDTSDFGEALRTLRATIESDVAQLVADRYRVYRPAVFFMTDGRPTDRSADWLAALAALRSPEFPHRPHMVAFGFGDADAEILREIGDVAAYTAADAASAPAAIAAFGALLVESVVASGAAGAFRLPDALPGGLEEIDDELEYM